jgi:hypothetical protein
MNQKPETAPQSNSTEQRAEIERELRLAKEYWLRTIYPHIKGRVLRGVEFFIAQDAHLRLQMAVRKAREWNEPFASTPDTARMPVSVDVDLTAENFREPEAPEMLFAANMKPEILATVAAPLVSKGQKTMTPDEAIRRAHELLMAAERYIGTLPKNKGGMESFARDFELASSYVTFKEIAESNKKGSGQLPLLPPLQTKQKGRGEKEIHDEPLSLKQIRVEVRKFRQNQIPVMIEEEYEEPEQPDANWLPGWFGFRTRDEIISDYLKHNWIVAQDLCTLRWERFKQFAQKQQERAVKREAKKSAAPNPPAAGKRKQ